MNSERKKRLSEELERKKGILLRIMCTTCSKDSVKKKKPLKHKNSIMPSNLKGNTEVPTIL